MGQIIGEFVATVVITAIAYILLSGLGQKQFSMLVLLCGFLSFALTFSEWAVPFTNNAKVKLTKAEQDFNNFTKVMDKVGTGINKIGGTKENLDAAVEKTKIPYLAKVDQTIEKWWADLINGKEK